MFLFLNLLISVLRMSPKKTILNIEQILCTNMFSEVLFLMKKYGS